LKLEKHSLSSPILKSTSTYEEKESPGNQSHLSVLFLSCTD